MTKKIEINEVAEEDNPHGIPISECYGRDCLPCKQMNPPTTDSARFRPLTEIPLTHSPPPDVVGSHLPEGAFRWDIRLPTDITRGDG